MPTLKAGSPELAEYLAALNAHNAAIRKFHTVRDQYRAGLVDDAAFIAARKVYDAATAAYDVAYAKAEQF